jgi:heptosyltransferase-3
MLLKGNLDVPVPKTGILLIQLGDIGDVVLTMPAIRALKDTFPSCPLHVAVRDKARELIDECPWTDATIAVSKQKRTLMEQLRYQTRFFTRLHRLRCAWAVDLRSGTRGAVLARMSGAPVRIGRYSGDGWLWRNRMFTHLVNPPDETQQYAAFQSLNILSPFGIKATDVRPRLSVTLQRRQRAESLLPEIRKGSPIVAIHPFSLWAYKEWRQSEVVRLVDYLHDRYQATVILTGSMDERSRAEALANRCRHAPLNLAGLTRIGDMPALLSLCCLLIGVDTAALHIAAAVGVPTIGIFGPSPAVVWATPGDAHLVVTGPLDCIPCRQKGCSNAEKSRCLEELNFEDIRDSLDRHMNNVFRMNRQEFKTDTE